MTARYILILLLLSFSSKAQIHDRLYVETIVIAATEGISIKQLDSSFISAVHVDSSKAVFKSNESADSMRHAYSRFLGNFGAYLRMNGFKWGQPTRCWNKIYFQADGTVRYYLFDFKTEIGAERLKRYKELFKAYASINKIGISASVNFAHCSSVTYQD